MAVGLGVGEEETAGNDDEADKDRYRADAAGRRCQDRAMT